MERYEGMSRDELLREVFRLEAELLGERAQREALEHFMKTSGFTFTKDQDDSKHTVVERRPYRNGQLTLEYRRNKKTGNMVGPYWQYRGVQDGKQVNIYLGKTDDPEGRADEKLGG